MDPALEFDRIFEHSPDAVASAPGRVNMLGEHTDYNNGYVLPAAIPQRTVVAAGFGKDKHRAYSANFNDMAVFGPDDELAGFARYVGGCIRIINEHISPLPFVDLWMHTEVPVGAGLSSSAALEVAVLRALSVLFELDFDNVRIAQFAHQAEVRYAGVNCGIMDQMASSLAEPGSLLFLDTQFLETRVVPIPANAEILVVDSGVPRTLATSGYNQRRAECEKAAKILGVESLRHVQDGAELSSLPATLRKRVRHVVSENSRVLAALDADAPGFGRLMNDSHASQRDDYEVSVPAMDAMVEELQQTPGVFGARMTGGGFGGAAVALIVEGSAAEIAQRCMARNRKVIVPAPLDPL